MEAVLIILLAGVCTALPLVLGQRYGVVRWVSPMHLVAYFCFFGFLVKVTVYAVAPEMAFYRRFVENPWGDQLGALYLALFVLALCIGYGLGCATGLRSGNVAAARLVASGLIRRRSLFLLAFGVAMATGLAILHARGAGFDLDMLVALNTAKQIDVNAAGVGATLAGLKTFFIVPKFAFVLLLAYGISVRSPGAMAQAGLLALLLVMIALISGDRFELIELLVFGLAVLMILGHSLNRRVLGGLIIIAAILCGAGMAMTRLRLGMAEPIWAAMARQIVGSTYFLDINAAVMITDRVHSDDLLLGQSYLWWSFGWVPRAVWPDKPAIDLGVFFKREVMGVYTGGAFNVTGPGEAFINFGWAGSAMGLALGWLYRKGEVALLSALAAIRHGAFLLYPMLFYPFIQATLQSSFSAFVVGACAQLVLLVAMIRFFVIRYAVRMPLRHDHGSLRHAA